jgi:hypothetical protein
MKAPAVSAYGNPSDWRLQRRLQTITFRFLSRGWDFQVRSRGNL